MDAVEKSLENLMKDDIPSIKTNEIYEYVVQKRHEVVIVTVKFTTPDLAIFTQSYAAQTSIEDIKSVLQEVFKLSSEFIEISKDGEDIRNELTLYNFDFGEHRCLDFYLRSTHPEKYISAKQAYEGLAVPDIITVTVEYDDGSTKEVVVEIESKTILKPYLGGYLNKVTQIEYHHGYSQTGPPPPKVVKTHRDTQTYWMRNRLLDTHYSRATQMAKSDIYIPSITDRILTSGPYETADEREARLDIEGKVRIIQRYFRAWKLRKALKILCEEYRKRIRLELEDEAFLIREDEERKKRELIGKVYPRTKSDFYMLYKMLENWKKAEIERIKTIACGPSKLAEMYLLLEKEIAMLLSIERQKEVVKQDLKIKKDIEFLKIISEPLAWNSDYKNLFIEMDTLETQKGREYFELYQRLCDHTLDRDSKLEVYFEVKMSLEGHVGCEIGLEILSLIERACILITRGISDCHLETLQMRIEACVLKHLKMTVCCEGVAMRNARVREKLMKDNMFYCSRCKTFKTSDEFAFDTRTNTLCVCNSCSWSDKIMEPWMDIQPYRYLLKCIRREERRQSSHSSIAFILTEKDLYYIVNQIWHSHSAISECNDIYKLRLCRFFRDEDWAPWNCILLTYEETKCHLKVKSMEKVYDQEFLQHVNKKHIISKSYFAGVKNLNNYFEDIGRVDSRWDEIIEKREFVAVNSKMKIFLSCH
ncbi:PREDICTED: IQ and ubiquitin-like domain-containing protein [Nicrophorus vespilloides]|uniref:IQ and ubiquitin-like domain-containing protein n=1 Tax=Nicrophorus vespilloides TaxID=110193 RepID=A0ABM1MDT5_NICVS|nr:PREDICTED: IQ and ubiquitin-like domain-containing protein [Nicrophorus vespilloides]